MSSNETDGQPGANSDDVHASANSMDVRDAGANFNDVHANVRALVTVLVLCAAN